MNTVLSRESQKPTIDRSADRSSNLSSESKMTRYYQADQQVKYLHLQAEIEVLIQQLQTLKHQKYLSEVSQR
ncbi:MAG: hypothetical protein QNJ41_07240 [Xenococcaceae cyanobacterium MO_188.B32]|nr:hypothetical protein [Xenococcaceae cyanobacterium MO_188.B32]